MGSKNKVELFLFFISKTLCMLILQSLGIRHTHARNVNLIDRSIGTQLNASSLLSRLMAACRKSFRFFSNQEKKLCRRQNKWPAFMHFSTRLANFVVGRRDEETHFQVGWLSRQYVKETDWLSHPKKLERMNFYCIHAYMWMYNDDGGGTLWTLAKAQQRDMKNDREIEKRTSK